MDSKFTDVNISFNIVVKPTIVSKITNPLLTLGSLDNYIAINDKEMVAQVFYFSNGIVTYGNSSFPLIIKNNKLFVITQYSAIELEEEIQKKFFELAAEKELLS